MSTDFWRQFQLRLDPWGADYEAPVHLHEAGDASMNAVDAGIENRPWAPVTPKDGPLPARLLFIDGRRRLDARLVGRSDGEVLYGAFATIAAGAVVVDRDRQQATCLEPHIRRVLAFGSDHRPTPTRIPCPLGSPAELWYDHCLSGPDHSPETPLTLVQNAMLDLEAALAKAYLGEDALVVRDGPLRYGTPERAVGYVKTMHQTYLPPANAALLWELAVGQRTPLFAIGAPGYDGRRWSWYLRSGTPEEAPEKLGYHGLHGLVRLELHHGVSLDEAVAIADATTRLIPQFASRQYRDPRAPQNLTPVGALERELGRRMGDPALIGRRIGHFLATLDSPKSESPKSQVDLGLGTRDLGPIQEIS